MCSRTKTVRRRVPPWNPMERSSCFCPGPPSEMEPMFCDQVRPYLEGKTGQIFLSQTVHLFGIGESAAEEILRSWMEASKNPTVAPYAKTGEVLLRVTAAAPDRKQARKLLEPAVQEIQKRLGAYVYGVDVGTLQNAVVLAMKHRGLTVSTAESCTGGGVAKRITEVSGASAVLRAGICTYTNEMKTALLGVKEKTLKSYGAVSAQTALEMARGVKARTGSDIGVSVTGVAGPQPSEEKPVGLVLCRCPVRGMSRRCSCIWPEAAAMSGSGYDAWRKITRCMACCRRLKRRRSAEV